MKRLMMLIFAALLLTGCRKNADSFEIDADIVTTTYDEEVSLEDDSFKDTIFVYVCGAVKKPGVYELKSGSRVYEAINAAGGMSSIAAENAINQAELLSDGQQIFVSDKAGTNDAINSIDSAKSTLININTASATELMNITGIGQTKAESIVSFRESNGKFKKTEDITKVTGIGEATYLKIKDQITVG